VARLTAPSELLDNLRWKPLHQILDLDAGLPPGDTSAMGDRLDLRKKTAVALTIRALFNPSATGDLIVHVYSSHDDDDYAGDYDVEEFTQIVVPVGPGGWVQKTAAINASARFIAVTVENTDGTYTVGDVRIWAAPLSTEELATERLTGYDWS